MYWWHNNASPESLLQKPSNRYRQPFKVRWHMFSKKQLESDKLPPKFSALKYMIHRSHHITSIWKSAISTNPILPDPENLGWKKLTMNMNHLWQTNFLLVSWWSNLVCVHARKQTAILYVVVARRKGWCVPIRGNVWTVQILNLISLNSQYKVDVFMMMNSQLLNTKSNPINWRGFFIAPSIE